MKLYIKHIMYDYEMNVHYKFNTVIGFERARYVFKEGPFEEFYTVPVLRRTSSMSAVPVRLLISYIATSPDHRTIKPATFDQDIDFGSTNPSGLTLQNSSEVSFTLLADSIPEGTEAFLIRIESDMTEITAGMFEFGDKHCLQKHSSL